MGSLKHEKHHPSQHGGEISFFNVIFSPIDPKERGNSGTVSPGWYGFHTQNITTDYESS